MSARTKLANRVAAARRLPPPDPPHKQPYKGPVFAKHPMQDSYGNPTTKKPGDTGTAIMFPHYKGISFGGNPYRDLYGTKGGKRQSEHPTKDYKSRLP